MGHPEDGRAGPVSIGIVQCVGAQTLVVPVRRVSWPRSDWVLPVVLALVAQADVWAPASYNLGHLTGPAPVVSILYVVTALALVWRKRSPVAVLAFIVSVDAVEYLGFGAPEGLGSLLPTVVAFYSVGRYARTGAVTVAAPLALLGIAVHELTDPVFTLTGSNAIFYAVVAGAWPLGQAFRRRAEHTDELQARTAELAAQRDRLAEAAARAERARIARELHDIVGHGLSITVLQLAGASALLENGRAEQAGERLASTERTARQTLTEMRRLLGLLDEGADPTLAPQPGLDQLEALIEATRRAGAQITTEVTGTPAALPPSLDLTVYRVLQEALTNVLKHAHPPVCTVRIGHEPHELALEVCDAGRTATPAPAGRGLAGMRERITVFGGTLNTGVTPTGGFTVCARLPVVDR
jgi:signal transduction histidine kinase